MYHGRKNTIGLETGIGSHEAGEASQKFAPRHHQSHGHGDFDDHQKGANMIRFAGHATAQAEVAYGVRLRPSGCAQRGRDSEKHSIQQRDYQGEGQNRARPHEPPPGAESSLARLPAAASTMLR